MELTIPTAKVIIRLHDFILQETGGKPGINRRHEIEAAAQRPQTYMGYVDDCDIHTVCAVLLDSISRNHGFKDGNKRTSLLTVLFTYTVNNIYIDASNFMNKDYEELVLWVVKQKPSIEKISEKLDELAKKYTKKGFEATIANLKNHFFPPTSLTS